MVGAPDRGPPYGSVGRYRLGRRLGAGGMGVVYLGYDRRTGVAAAVKVIRPEHAADPEFRARLRREVTAASRVPRFCTAPVLAADLDADPPWIATEYIDAPTLDAAILERGPLRSHELESFAAGVAVALRAIHQHGVVHRDLKPSNILLSPFGPRVIDFGIARLDEAGTQLTQTGVVVGTPAYMAPEQLRGEPATTAVDTFAWASLVTYAGTGRPPFGTGTAALHSILNEDPDLGDLPAPLRGLVAAALHKQPAARPSAAKLVEGLSHFAPEATTRVLAAAAATPPPPADPRPPARRSALRRWGLVAAGAALSVVVAATAVWLASGDTPAPSGAVRTEGAATPSPAQASPPVETLEPNPDPYGSLVVAPMTGHTDVVWSLAVGGIESTPIAVTGSEDQTVRVWDLATGDQLGEPLTPAPGHAVTAVAIDERDGNPALVSGGSDGVLRVWDLAGRRQAGPALGRTDVIRSVAVGELGGEPIAVAGGLDQTVSLWNLTTGEPHLAPLTGHTGTIDHVAVGTLDGEPIAVSQGVDELRVWDLATGRQLGAALDPGTEQASSVQSMAVGDLVGDPVAVVGTLFGSAALVWNLADRRLVRTLTGHADTVQAVAVGDAGGDPIAVTGSADQTVRVWNLATGEPLGEPFTGHGDVVTAVAVGERDGYPVVVSADRAGTVMVWSLG